MSSPGRPPNVRDVLLALNGCPVWLGSLVSTGSTVNNLTTTTPFNSAVTGTGSGPGALNYSSTLAGRVLYLHPTSAGLVMPSSSNAVTMTALTGAAPGVVVAAGPPGIIISMMSTYGWLQWQSTGGSGNLHVYELLSP